MHAKEKASDARGGWGWDLRAKRARKIERLCTSLDTTRKVCRGTILPGAHFHLVSERQTSPHADVDVACDAERKLE